MSSGRTGFLKYSTSGSETYKVKQRKKNKKNFMLGDLKRNRTLVAGMASDTHDYCATATAR